MRFWLSYKYESLQENLEVVRVTQVLDGDSIIVSKKNGIEFEIRLNEVDCPEANQPWGPEATIVLENLLLGKFVYIKYYGLCVYQRQLATIYLRQGSKYINVSEYLIAWGHGWVIDWHLTNLALFRHFKLIQLQERAKKNRLGLWNDQDAVKPMIFRRLG